MDPDGVPPFDRGSDDAVGLPGFPAEPSHSWPARALGSMRRTSVILSTWPEGPEGRLTVSGRARDVATSSAGEPRVLDEATIDVTFDPDRSIEAATVEPAAGQLDRLVGSGPGRGFRRAIAESFPTRADRRSLAYFLVEDLTTTPLLSMFALSRRAETQGIFVELSSGPISAMEGVCAGYRPDGLAMQLRRQNSQRSQNVAVIERHTTEDDQTAWHPLERPDGIAMCRRRFIDVVPQGDRLVIEAGFRDQTWEVDGREATVHEYELRASVDNTGSTMVLASLEATPLVIPYPDCPSAASEVDRLVGLPLPELRHRVLEELRGVESCTHLNDMIRALAELPDLVERANQGMS